MELYLIHLHWDYVHKYVSWAITGCMEIQIYADILEIDSSFIFC